MDIETSQRPASVGRAALVLRTLHENYQQDQWQSRELPRAALEPAATVEDSQTGQHQPVPGRSFVSIRFAVRFLFAPSQVVISTLAGSFYPFKMQFEVTKADSHKRTQHHSIDVIIPEELQVRVVLKIDIETSVCEVVAGRWRLCLVCCAV